MLDLPSNLQFLLQHSLLSHVNYQKMGLHKNCKWYDMFPITHNHIFWRRVCWKCGLWLMLCFWTIFGPNDRSSRQTYSENNLNHRPVCRFAPYHILWLVGGLLLSLGAMLTEALRVGLTQFLLSSCHSATYTFLYISNFPLQEVSKVADVPYINWIQLVCFQALCMWPALQSLHKFKKSPITCMAYSKMIQNRSVLLDCLSFNCLGDLLELLPLNQGKLSVTEGASFEGLGEKGEPGRKTMENRLIF